jgi:dihydroxy-acid dehydratase
VPALRSRVTTHGRNTAGARSLWRAGMRDDDFGKPIDVRARALEVLVPDEVQAERRAKMEASERPWQPEERDRPVSKALRADEGAVRQIP